MDRRRGRRIGPLAAQAVARDRGADQRRARPSLDLRLAARPRADAARVHGPCRARRRSCGTARELRALCPRGALAYDATDTALSPRRLAVSLARDRGVAVGPGRPQRGQRRRGARPPRRWRGPTRPGPPLRWPTSEALDGGSSCSGPPKTGVPIYDDYAHHPTEVAATIAAARTLAPARLVAVFQPHLYSRTRALAREFGARAGRRRHRRSCSPSTRPASAPRTSRASTGSWSPRPPPTPPAGGRWPGCRRSTTPARFLACDAAGGRSVPGDGRRRHRRRCARWSSGSRPPRPAPAPVTRRRRTAIYAARRCPSCLPASSATTRSPG